MKALKILLVGLWFAMSASAQTVTPNPGPYQNISTKYQYTWQKWSGGIWNLGKLVQADSALFSGITYVPNAPAGDSSTEAANTGWIKRNIAPGTPGQPVLAWAYRGNYTDAEPTQGRLGFIDSVDLHFITDNGIRLTIPSEGINRNGGAANKVLMIDTVTKKLYYADAGGGGGGSGTVTNVASGYGLLGGPITTTGTLEVDSTLFATQYDLSSGLALKVNISDTAAMLNGYVRRVHGDGSTTTVDNTDPRNPVISATGGGGTELTYLGSIYNNDTWASLSGFTQNGTTPTIVSGNIEFTGGTNNFTKTLDFDRYTDLKNYSITASFIVGTKSGTSYGMGVGTRSQSPSGNKISEIGALDLTNTGTAGKLNIYAGPSNTLVSTSSGSVACSAGDTVVLTLTRENNVITASAYNNTTRSLPVSVSHTYTYTSSAPFPTNIGKFAIFNMGGTQTLDSLSIYSTEKKMATVCIVGDSKMDGYHAGSYSNTLVSRLGRYYTTINLSGGSEGTSDVMNRTDEIIELAPKYVLLCIGRNDTDLGLSNATSIANYDTIVNRLTAVGIQVIHLLPLYEVGGVDQTYLRTHITTTYPSTFVDAALADYSGTATNVLDADGVHPNALGFQIIAEKVVTSGLILDAVSVGSDGQQWVRNGTSIGYAEGFVGVGTTAPIAPLHAEASTTNTTAIFAKAAGSGVSVPVVIGGDFQGRGLMLGQQGLTPSSTNFGGININATSTGAYIAAWSDIGAGTAGKLGVYNNFQLMTYGAGTLTTDASGNVTATSDERLKTNIKPATSGLKELMKLKPITYSWNAKSGNETAGTYLGFSAQNVKSSIPNSTGVMPDGMLTLQDRAIIATLVNAVKELSAEVDRLKKLIK